MKNFFVNELQASGKWMADGPDGEKVAVIDETVYRPNRLMRLPLNSKKGDHAPLFRIKGPPIADDIDEEIENLKQTRLSCYAVDLPAAVPVVYRLYMCISSIYV